MDLAFFLAWLLLTIALYASTKWLQTKVRFILIHPVLLPVAAIIGLLLLGVPSLQQFDEAGEVLTFFLGPSVVALGVKLHQQTHYLRKHLKAILWAVFLGAVTGVSSGLLLSFWAGSSAEVALTMSTRSVTAPISIAICEANGGLPSVAAGVVISTGIFGSVIGHLWLRLVGVSENIAKGLAMGSAAHGIGTAKALEANQQQGAFSGLAFGLSGILTSLLVPIFKLFILNSSSLF